jgi:type II secretory ATPase GspE/PulE/Tfp pilus assembly ATPase PilB-like protein
MEVEPFLTASSILAVIAQRLVRKVCPVCRKPYTPSAEEMRSLGLDRVRPGDTFYKADGCDECLGTGYAGRVAIYEILVVDDVIRDLIMQRADASTLKHEAMRRGTKTLRQDGLEKFRLGLTTAEEVMRVTQGDDS